MTKNKYTHRLDEGWSGNRHLATIAAVYAASSIPHLMSPLAQQPSRPSSSFLVTDIPAGHLFAILTFCRLHWGV